MKQKIRSRIVLLLLCWVVAALLLPFPRLRPKGLTPLSFLVEGPNSLNTKILMGSKHTLLASETFTARQPLDLLLSFVLSCSPIRMMIWYEAGRAGSFDALGSDVQQV